MEESGGGAGGAPHPRSSADGDPCADEVRFRTMPADLDQPITFVSGGDVFLSKLEEEIYRAAAALDPAFAVIGGDIVYDNGKRGLRWCHWLERWQKRMVTSEGCLIPLVPAIGNHEVAGQYGQTRQRAPFYYCLFIEPGAPSYRVLDFSDYMSIVLLDTGHTQAIDGEQARWLEKTLSARASVAHLFAVYHVPAYPSVRPFDRGASPLIREHWVPHFERFGVDTAFEHHDHAYKRTPLIKAGRPDPGGVLYLGDGAWGVTPRRVRSVQGTWYLEEARSINHFIATTIQGDWRVHRAVDHQGRVFDSWPE